jgi:hypothetical protein
MRVWLAYSCMSGLAFMTGLLLGRVGSPLPLRQVLLSGLTLAVPALMVGLWIGGVLLRGR